MLVIFHFIIHTCESEYMCTYYLNHIFMFYIFKMKTKRVVFYILKKMKRQWCLISFRVMRVCVA